MKRLILALAAMVLAASAAVAVAGPAEKPKEIHGVGCVEPGVEIHCLVVRDIKSGTLYNLRVKEPRPAVGEGIEFIGAPFEGVTVCMQGVAVTVTSWTKKDTLKCSKP